MTRVERQEKVKAAVRALLADGGNVCMQNSLFHIAVLHSKCG